MKIIRAKKLGFCFGVKRAFNTAIKYKNQKKVYTLGNLLHNNEIIKKLESFNIKKKDNPNSINNSIVIIRAHGTTEKNIQILKDNKNNIINATCPKVLLVHKLVKQYQKEKYNIVIFADPKHPETIGVASHVKIPIIIESLKDSKEIKNLDKVLLVSQTTQNNTTFNKIVDIIKNQNSNVKVFNTICKATQQRQDAAKKLAKKVDLMIIIGGKHSSNTQKLAQICKKITKTHHIENHKEIKNKWFKETETIGISAGASTPEWSIKRVEKTIRNIDNRT